MLSIKLEMVVPNYNKQARKERLFLDTEPDVGAHTEPVLITNHVTIKIDEIAPSYHNCLNHVEYHLLRNRSPPSGSFRY